MSAGLWPQQRNARSPPGEEVTPRRSHGLGGHVNGRGLSRSAPGRTKGPRLSLRERRRAPGVNTRTGPGLSGESLCPPLRVRQPALPCLRRPPQPSPRPAARAQPQLFRGTPAAAPQGPAGPRPPTPTAARPRGRSPTCPAEAPGGRRLPEPPPRRPAAIASWKGRGRGAGPHLSRRPAGPGPGAGRERPEGRGAGRPCPAVPGWGGSASGALAVPSADLTPREDKETEINYEDQISKIVVEKQELEWQKETLQHQTDMLQQQNKEAMAAFKKQLQARMFAMEEEKGKYQLAVETKEKEIDGLKETLKALQISKYTLQKKLNEMDQKLQLHLTAREEHHKKLNEVERCYATIVCQFGIVKGVHGQLEHSVQEAIQLNKKLTSVNKKQETEISNLKEELKKVTTDLIRSKVTSQYRVGEENINLAAREKQFQELQQKIRMEEAVSKKVKEENTQIKGEKLEANMRREIATIKNELNSLKGDQGHLEDYPPPRGNQHAEQVESLQSGQEPSKYSEMQTTQKENESMQSILRKDSILGHEDEIEVKNSLNIEELQIEQNLQVLENSFKDEINVASHYEEKQREVSPRNTLCTDTDLITQGRTSEIRVTECKEAENLETTYRMLLEESNAKLEQKLQDSTDPVAACHTETRKVFLDSTDTVFYEKNASQDTNSSKQELYNTTHESICTEADKQSNTIEHNSALMPEASEKESEAVICIEKNVVCERMTDNHQAKEFNFGILPYAKENSQTEYQKCSLLDSDNYVGNRLHRTEKNLLKVSGLHRDKFPFKQTHVDAEDRNYNDKDRNMNRNSALRSTGIPATDAQNIPSVCCDNASASAAAKEHSSNMPVSGTSNLCPETVDRGINVDDRHSKQTEQGSTEQSGGDTNTCTPNAEAVSPVKAADLEITVHKVPTDGISTDKLFLCEKLNDDIQIQFIKNGHSLEINDNSINNTLLKEKKGSLHSTDPGRKFAEGHLKESCSLPMRTSGNLVNVSGRSSFDLSTSDKKAEKTPVHFNFLDLGSCSRVNQMRSQVTWTSASKEPPVLKEKLPCLVENRKVISKAPCQSPNENVAKREKGLGSISSNRAADTLSTSSIHRDPQGDPSEEWNATAKTFYDSSFPTEHVKEGFTASHEQKSSHVTVTPAKSERMLGDEGSCSTHNSNIQNQIEEIEKFLQLERLCSSRKRKHEDRE
ncbi:coiled-coil domain-containing protein 73 isoform X6 [Anser cygnoides]|uniref:coiled-coil domain-containing protein 73 isoform X6 n=1 Tax=Anser cygnoides TaxID=8845 RepID=UPI0034D35313